MTKANAVLFTLCLMASACGGGSGAGSCSAATCMGCCDGSGVCQLGTATNSCGASGHSCTACGSGLVCSAGACTPDAGSSTGFPGTFTGVLTQTSTITATQQFTFVITEAGSVLTINGQPFYGVPFFADVAGKVAMVRAQQTSNNDDLVGGTLTLSANGNSIDVDINETFNGPLHSVGTLSRM